MSRSLTPEVLRLLEGANFGHLATLMPDGEPKVDPVWVGHDGVHVLVATDGKSIKTRNAEHDPRVALSVTRFDDPYEQVLVRGHASNTLRYWAYATWDGSGQPVMIFNLAALAQVPPIVTRFAFYHECAHLTLRSTDELQANCEALKLMRLRREVSPVDEAVLKQEHYRLTALGSQYLGSGKALWDATVACANAH